MVSVPLLTERMGVNYFEENLLELYLQVKCPPGYCTVLATVRRLNYFCFEHSSDITLDDSLFGRLTGTA